MRSYAHVCGSYDFNQSDLECALATLRMYVCHLHALTRTGPSCAKWRAAACHRFLGEQSDIPWAALVYVTGEINYGGRVTDDLDRRLLLTILKIYYTPKALKDSYSYSSSGVYKPPLPSVERSLELAKEFIAAMPQSEEPEVFGMHENANMTFQMQETDKILDTVLSMQPRETNTIVEGIWVQTNGTEWDRGFVTVCSIGSV